MAQSKRVIPLHVSPSTGNSAAELPSTSHQRRSGNGNAQPQKITATAARAKQMANEKGISPLTNNKKALLAKQAPVVVRGTNTPSHTKTRKSPQRGTIANAGSPANVGLFDPSRIELAWDPSSMKHRVGAGGLLACRQLHRFLCIRSRVIVTAVPEDSWCLFEWQSVSYSYSSDSSLLSYSRIAQLRQHMLP